MSFVRCDRSSAWAALQGHYEAHGRSFDLREAFARDPHAILLATDAAASAQFATQCASYRPTAMPPVCCAMH